LRIAKDDLGHRNLGVKLKLRRIQEDAPGMAFWRPRGYAIYRALKDYARRKMRRAIMPKYGRHSCRRVLGP
jgi:threonyl-tRNA synthetase